jgi:transcriptional regulator GlxA family with amidase domain
MDVAVLTFDGFNELDSFVVASLLNRLEPKGVRAFITAPTARVTSRAGLVVEAQKPLEFAAQADAVVIGSGIHTAEVAEEASVMQRIQLDPQRQWIASQCSGWMMLQKLGVLGDAPVCADLPTQPIALKRGLTVLPQPFTARGNVASAGGCLASQYIATWLVARKLGEEEAAKLIHYVAPVGEKEQYVERALAAVRPYLPRQSAPQPVAR